MADTHWEKLFGDIKSLEQSWNDSREKCGKLEALLEKERKETARITEALNHTVEHLEGRMGALRQDNDLLRNKEVELKEQISMFSNSLFEVKKALGDTHSQFKLQKEQFERHVEKLQSHLSSEKSRGGELERRLVESEKMSNSLLKDLRKYDIRAKKADELERTVSTLMNERDSISETLDRKNKELNNERLEYSRSQFRVQQLEQDLKRQSMLMERVKQREAAIKKNYIDQKKFNQDVTKAVRPPLPSAEEIRRARATQSKSPNTVSDDSIKQSLWNKKREIAKVELKAKDLPSGHPERESVVERLHNLKKERASLQRAVNRHRDEVRGFAGQTQIGPRRAVKDKSI